MTAIKKAIPVNAAGTLTTETREYRLILTRNNLIVAPVAKPGEAPAPIQCLNIGGAYHPFMLYHRGVWNLENLSRLLPGINMQGATVRGLTEVQRAAG
ncbi:MAG: hypothetical protein ACPG7F_00630 [Aggregatilineales bacterium]